MLSHSRRNGSRPRTRIPFMPSPRPSSNDRERSRWRPDSLLAATVPAVVWVCYSPMRRLWWTYDDFFHLHYLSTHHLLSILFRPSTWQELPFRMFTPALFVSLDFDRLLWGVRPEPFYWHQLATLSLGGIALYFTARLSFPRLFAASTAYLFLLGAPMCATAPLLMERHYFDGLAAGALTVFLFVHAIRTGRRPWALLSAVVYFAAMTAKEIYVPVIFLLALLPESDFKNRRKMLAPHAVALAAYLAWRLAMLGTLGGGYGWAIEPAQVPRILAALPFKICETFLGHDSLVAILACTLMGVSSVIWAIRRKKIGVILVLAVLTILPFATVASVIEPRYGILAWLLFSVTFVAACAALWQKGSRVGVGVLLAAVLVLLAIANRQEWSTTLELLGRMSSEAKDFSTLTRADVLAHPAVPPASMAELQWLDEHVLHRPDGADWFYDDIYLCEHRDGTRRVWEFNPAMGTISALGVKLEALRAASCAMVRDSEPLMVELRSKTGDLFWSLGPYTSGSYSFVLDNGRRAYEVPRAAGYQFGTLATVSLRTKYTSPRGWSAYSPLLTIALDHDRRLKWSRPSRAP